MATYTAYKALRISRAIIYAAQSSIDINGDDEMDRYTKEFFLLISLIFIVPPSLAQECDGSGSVICWHGGDYSERNLYRNLCIFENISTGEYEMWVKDDPNLCSRFDKWLFTFDPRYTPAKDDFLGADIRAEESNPWDSNRAIYATIHSRIENICNLIYKYDYNCPTCETPFELSFKYMYP
jgi:hypothetical protein